MKNNKWMIPLLGTILLGISSWVVITVVELQAIVEDIEANARKKSPNVEALAFAKFLKKL